MILPVLLTVGWALVLFLPFQIRRSWDMPWLPFGIGSWRLEPFHVRLAWVPA
jgi:hypothetical protein